MVYGHWAWSLPRRAVVTVLSVVPKLREIESKEKQALAAIQAATEDATLTANLVEKAIEVQRELALKILESGASFQTAKCLEALGAMDLPVAPESKRQRPALPKD